jgi:peptidoglycan hydrolase CwlO-like protein
MGNRAIRKAIQSLRKRITEHWEKIERERGGPDRNDTLIRYWEKEIDAFTIRLRRLEDRLAHRQRRGRG